MKIITNKMLDKLTDKYRKLLKYGSDEKRCDFLETIAMLGLEPHTRIQDGSVLIVPKVKDELWGFVNETILAADRNMRGEIFECEKMLRSANKKITEARRNKARLQIDYLRKKVSENERFLKRVKMHSVGWTIRKGLGL